MKTRYIIGIDLGTTNSAAGYIDLHEAAPGAIEIHTFKIPQLVARQRLGEETSLPSFLYLPGEFDLKPGDTALPWSAERDYAVGTFARDQGALVPDRLVSSAKSWLCHGGVDREADILPWGAGDDVKKISPVAASSRYLQHIREAWDYSMPEPLEKQTVVLTVPASFDEVARELTLKAAKQAGLPSVILLEEPLAAFYSWLSLHEANWQEHLSPGDLLLVCDVGGGTTDFTMIACREGKEGPGLERLAVGDHLLLGGDNMDLALAAVAEGRLGKELDPARWNSLIHQCRQVKERLLGSAGEESAAIRLTGRGRSLIGGTMVLKLQKDEVRDALLNGFFPEIDMEKDLGDGKAESAGLREMGLPYVNDPAVTRHLAKFMIRQGHGHMPTVVLFNGGALKPDVIRQRLLKTVGGWAGHDVRSLDNRSLDLAISWGAAYYGLVRYGLGLKVGGGIARSYYIGVGTGREKEGRARAVCLVERGTEENEEVELSSSFQVLTNRPVKFTLYSSTTRTGDRAGDVITPNPEELIKLPPLQSVLRYGKKGRDVSIPVVVGAKITVIGTLELYCKAKDTPHRWRLQFRLRDNSQEKSQEKTFLEGVRVAPASGKKAEPEKGLTEDDRQAIAAAMDLVSRCFKKDPEGEAVSPEELPRLLARATGLEKELWPVPMLRSIAEELLKYKAVRGRTPQMESRWFNLLGFCMRPGLGEVNDPWRIKKIWPLFFEGLTFARDQGTRLQWWIFWRRVAGGLGTGQQNQFFSTVSGILLPQSMKGKRRRKVKPPKVTGEERREIWLCVANMERLDVGKKIELGDEILKIACKQQHPWAIWTLSRIGARQPLYGPADRVVPPGRVAMWLEQIRRTEWRRPGMVSAAAISMARVTADRARDIAARAREELATYLETMGMPHAKTEPLRAFVPIAGSEKVQAFGESLPEGLILGEKK